MKIRYRATMAVYDRRGYEEVRAEIEYDALDYQDAEEIAHQYAKHFEGAEILEVTRMT